MINEKLCLIDKRNENKNQKMNPEFKLFHLMILSSNTIKQNILKLEFNFIFNHKCNHF
jgi:hypothetical protein